MKKLLSTYIYIMKKIYNIALFSAVPATATNNEQFFFDWTQIEDVPRCAIHG